MSSFARVESVAWLPARGLTIVHLSSHPPVELPGNRQSKYYRGDVVEIIETKEEP